MNINKRSAKLAGISALVVLWLVNLSVFTIETGTVGVVSTMGKYDPDEVQPGLHFRIPFVQQVIVVDTKVHTVNYTINSSSNGPGVINRRPIVVLDDRNLAIGLDVSVQFHPVPELADVILAKYGKNYFEKRMNPIIRNVVRDAAGKYQAETIAMKRDELTGDLNSRIRQAFEGSEFVVDNVALRAIRLPKVVREKVEEVQKAKQEEQRLTMVERQAKRQQEIERINAQTRLIKVTTKAKAEAERKKIEAEAQAYAVLTKAKAQAKANRLVSASLTPNLIKYHQINKWDGVLPKTMMGDSSNAVLMLGDQKNGNGRAPQNQSASRKR